MKTLSIVLLFGAFVARDGFAQSTNITVSATIEAAAPTCTFGGEENLEFGDIQRPASGNGTATYDPAVNDGELSETGVVSTGTPSIGELSVTASNSANVVVSYTPITSLALAGTPSKTMPFSVDWASSEDDATWSGLSSATFTGLVGVGSSKTYYFQVGGELTVAFDQDLGAYSQTLSFSASCP